MEQFDFGRAIVELRNGNRVQRTGWNGRGMHIQYRPTEVVDGIFYNEYLLIKNVNDSVSTWVPSINDVFATDWQLA